MGRGTERKGRMIGFGIWDLVMITHRRRKKIAEEEEE